MIFPVWARDDSCARMAFLCHHLALMAGPEPTVRNLAKISGVTHATIYRAMRNGFMSRKSAGRICEKIPECDIPVSWLVAPENITLDSNGGVQ